MVNAAAFISSNLIIHGTPTSGNWTEINRLKVYRITIILRQHYLSLMQGTTRVSNPLCYSLFNLIRQSLIIRWFRYLVFIVWLRVSFYISSTTYSYSLTIPLIGTDCFTPNKKLNPCVWGVTATAGTNIWEPYFYYNHRFMPSHIETMIPVCCLHISLVPVSVLRRR